MASSDNEVGGYRNRPGLQHMPDEIIKMMGDFVADRSSLFSASLASRTLNSGFLDALYQCEATKPEKIGEPCRLTVGPFGGEIDEAKAPAILWAISEGQYNHIEQLLRKGLDINRIYEIRYRFHSGYYGASNFEKVFFWGSALAWACLVLSVQDSTDMVNFLLAKGANANIGATGDFFAFLEPRPWFQLIGPWRAELRLGQGWSPVALAMMASWNRDATPAVSAMLDRGALVSAAWHPWHQAGWRCTATGRLHQRCNSTDDRLTILHYAATSGHVGCIRRIAQRFPDLLEARDRHRLTPLHWAAFGQDPARAVACLLRLGANVDAQASQALSSRSPLESLAPNPLDESGVATSLLIKAGARLNQSPIRAAYLSCAIAGYFDARLLTYMQNYIPTNVPSNLLLSMPECDTRRDEFGCWSLPPTRLPGQTRQHICWDSFAVNKLADAAGRLELAGRPLGRTSQDDLMVGQDLPAFDRLFKHHPVEHKSFTWTWSPPNGDWLPKLRLNPSYQADDIGLHWRPRTTDAERWWAGTQRMSFRSAKNMLPVPADRDGWGWRREPRRDPEARLGFYRRWCR